MELWGIEGELENWGDCQELGKLGGLGVTGRTGGGLEDTGGTGRAQLGVKQVRGSYWGCGWTGSHWFELGSLWMEFSVPQTQAGGEGERTSQTTRLGGFIRN